MTGESRRVSDTERNDVVELLGVAFSEGRLNYVEHQDRVDAALAAVTEADLGVLTSDLVRRSAPRADEPSRTRRTVLAVLAALVVIGGMAGAVIWAVSSTDDSSAESTDGGGQVEVADPPEVDDEPTVAPKVGRSFTVTIEPQVPAVSLADVRRMKQSFADRFGDPRLAYVTIAGGVATVAILDGAETGNVYWSGSTWSSPGSDPHPVNADEAFRMSQINLARLLAPLGTVDPEAATSVTIVGRGPDVEATIRSKITGQHEPKPLVSTLPRRAD